MNYETPDPECPLAVVADRATATGDSFINVNVTPQGQASAVMVRVALGTVIGSKRTRFPNPLAGPGFSRCAAKYAILGTLCHTKGLYGHIVALKRS